jgi:hypothetical protein
VQAFAPYTIGTVNDPKATQYQQRMNVLRLQAEARKRKADAEAANRPGLAPIAERLRAELVHLAAQLQTAAASGISPEARDRLRGEANSLVVRTAQAALTASKGAGFVAGHPAERLVRESLFFLVWSCPQTVADAMLCDLAGT